MSGMRIISYSLPKGADPRTVLQAEISDCFKRSRRLQEKDLHYVNQFEKQTGNR